MKITAEINGELQIFEVPDETVGALQAIANRNGISLGEALQQAIANENFLEGQQENGKLLIEKNGTIHELVRKPTPA